MKLQRLELFGFKSFADRVSIDFNPGITAIVGPNGCGKSNISDAIRWVLGEQRPTLVRGSKMEEVIFNGTRDRKPINLAEVRLHFSNESGLLPIEYAEVSIARRVFREGESEYLLNRQTCRLRDVQDLFMGTGVGTHSYSLIQQGMVDSVLSDRAEERRTLFEEAAGVTRYKNRRRAAERKLEATERDLERVEDIVGEVEKTVASLKRQVGKARRWRAYRDEEVRLDVHAAARERGAIAEREGPLVERLERLVEAEAEEAARLAEREAELEGLEIALVEGRDEAREARQEAEDLRRSIGRREDSRLVTGESLKHNRARLEALDTEDARADERAVELTERRAALAAERAEAAARFERIRERLGPAADEAADDEHLAELRAERSARAAEVEAARERLAEIDRAAARQASAEEVTAERLETLRADREIAVDEREAAERALAEARKTLATAERERARADEDLAETRGDVRAASEALDAARETLAVERAAEGAAAGRLEALVALESSFEGYARGARALLAEGGVDGLAGALPQAVEPAEPRFETVLDRYLESLGHGLLARDAEVALEAVRRIEDLGGGRADLLVPEFLVDGEPPTIPDGAAAVVLARGRDAVRWTGDPALGEDLAPLFDRLLVVADRAAAFRCRKALGESPEAARRYVVAGLDGTLIEPVGRWSVPGSADEEGPLARRRRRGELEAEVAQRDERVTELSATVEARERELVAAEDARDVAEEVARRSLEEHRVAREALAVAEQVAGQTGLRASELDERAREAEAALERAREALATLAATRAGVEAERARAAERLEAVREALESHERARIDRQSARHAVELERAAAEGDLKAFDREIEHVEAAEGGLARARQERADERARIEEANARLEAEREATGEEIAALLGRLEEVEARVREAEARVREAEEKRAAFESEARALRRRHEETTERRHEATLARQDLAFRKAALAEHLAERYEEPLEELVHAHPLVDDEAELDLEGLRERLEEVRRKLANVGPVNMLAVEEHEREAERLAFLVEQRDDLVQARRQLDEAIRRINGTARELFEETFEKVRANFDATFRTLFEGGHAEIRLEEPDDPLESPIEIVASPRGKRVQSINLLSGGERALTALSLLFAIYQVKPSPFCILDEVDAPLDDANVSRFLHMVRHFTDRTQFIVITHNKRTMEAADWLYGVTMEEPGISTLVSVSLDGAPVEGADRNGHPEDGNGDGNGRAAGEETRTLEEVWAPA